MCELLVISSPQLAAFAVGGAVTYPSVLLQQLKSNDTIIRLDLESSSWIGSIDGLAGIPSIIMPAVMQWRGRKFAFLTACIISILGWIFTYFANTLNVLYFSECLHGLGSHCILNVSLLSMSEMVAPKYRNISLTSFSLVQCFGMSIVGVLAQFLHWKVISLIMCIPLTAAFLIACAWPESPYWLAYKGEFRKSKDAFFWLRGVDDNSKQELKDFLLAYREEKIANRYVKTTLLNILKSVTQRNFYLPCLSMFILLYAVYWQGLQIVMIYFVEIIRRSTNNEAIASKGNVISNTTMFLSIAFVTVLLKFFNNKSVILTGNILIFVVALSMGIVSYLQSAGVIPRDSLLGLYGMTIYVICISFCVSNFTIPGELMPVKHRGLGGIFFIIFVGVLHTSSAKIAPYLFLYIDLWGTFLLFTANALICGLLIWKYVPETKEKTLQEIEDYYTTLNFNTKINRENHEDIDFL